MSLRTGIPLEARIAALKQYGEFSVAYSATVQPGLEHYGDERGFIAYRRVSGIAQVLAEPVAQPDYRDELIDRFIAEKGAICWWQIGRPLAKRLSDRGFRVNRIGTESRLQLDGYSFSGPARRNLRRALAKTDELGVAILEAPLASLDRRALAARSDDWRRTRPISDREMTFLVRPAVLADEPGVRKFLAFGRERQPLGFAFFDPIFEAGTPVGYLCSAKRTLPDAHPLLSHALVARALETFKAEGRKYLFLGLSPAKLTEPEEFPHSRPMRLTLQFLYQNGWFNRRVYSLKGLSQHKQAFGGDEEPSYCAFNCGPGLARLYSLMQVCNIVRTRGYVPAMAASASRLSTQSTNGTA
jgi:lysylphosphatidylglycerol synthetase-like protein (DUF2156 family)